jgi:hypothetical protein
MNTNHRPRTRRGENVPNRISTYPPRAVKRMDSKREIATSSCLGDFYCPCAAHSYLARGTNAVPDLSNLHSSA